MTNTQQNRFIEDFLQIFVDSIKNTLSKSLDNDVCKEIDFIINSASKVQDVEELRANNAIYKLDYSTGNLLGAFVVLIPEEVIANISDVLTGGSGIGAYKGSLSEIEKNSILNVLEKVFRNIENDFKKYYERDLVFSATSSLLLKEMPNHSLKSETSTLAFVVNNTLNLTKENEYSINLILGFDRLISLMKDLGLYEDGSIQNKIKKSSIGVDNLAEVKINVTAELGRTRVPIKYALELVPGSLIELDTVKDSDIKVFANGVEFAHAQVVAVEENFGLKITKIVSSEERLANI